MVVDDVLYKDISADGDGSSLELYAYPKLKNGNLFVCPTSVTKISVSAFVGVRKLSYVYFSHDSIEWEGSYAFSGTLGISVLKEKTTFEVDATGVKIYSMVSSTDCAYNSEKGVIEFYNNFKPETENCFLKVVEDSGRFSIVMFDFDFSAETSAIVEGSMIKLDSVLSE